MNYILNKSTRSRAKKLKLDITGSIRSIIEQAMQKPTRARLDFVDKFIWRCGILYPEHWDEIIHLRIIFTVEYNHCKR